MLCWPPQIHLIYLDGWRLFRAVPLTTAFRFAGLTHVSHCAGRHQAPCTQGIASPSNRAASAWPRTPWTSWKVSGHSAHITHSVSPPAGSYSCGRPSRVPRFTVTSQEENKINDTILWCNSTPLGNRTPGGQPQSERRSKPTSEPTHACRQGCLWAAGAVCQLHIDTHCSAHSAGP